MKKLVGLWGAFRKFYHSKTIVVIAVVVIVIGAIAIAYRVDSTFHWGVFANAKTLEVPMAVPVHKGANTEAILTKWVFDHSKNISRRTAREEVVEAMKTNKPLFILALVAVESEYANTATSNVGAKGLTQVMWKAWGQDLIKAGICKEERDLYDVDTSIRAGNYVLDVLLKDTGGDVTRTLERYLGGKDGWYKNRITENLSNIYLATSMAKEN